MLDSAIVKNSLTGRDARLAGNAATLKRFPAKWNCVAAAGSGALALNHRRRRGGLRGALAGGLGRFLGRRRLGRGRGRVGVGRSTCRGRRRRVVGGLDGVVLNLLFLRPQLGDVLLMLVVGFGKGMPAGTVG